MFVDRTHEIIYYAILRIQYLAYIISRMDNISRVKSINFIRNRNKTLWSFPESVWKISQKPVDILENYFPRTLRMPLIFPLEFAFCLFPIWRIQYFNFKLLLFWLKCSNFHPLKLKFVYVKYTIILKDPSIGKRGLQCVVPDAQMDYLYLSPSDLTAPYMKE